LMSVSRVRKLLREGANVHACRNPGEDTPLSLALNAKAHGRAVVQALQHQGLRGAGRD